MMRRVLFVLGFGLLPIWAACGLFIYGLIALPSDQAAMTLWSLVLAIPATSVTLGIAGIAIAIHVGTSGDARRKNLFAGGFVVGSVVLLVAAAVSWWLVREAREAELQQERRAVQAFVASHAEVRAAMPSTQLHASVAMSALAKSGWPMRYDVRVDTDKYMAESALFAIVNVTRNGKVPSFTLACTTVKSPGQREVGKDVCAR